MNRHYEFINREFNKYKIDKHIDVLDVSLFIKYVKKYLYYPFFYKKVSLRNIDYIVNKITTLLTKISSISSDLFFTFLIDIKKKLDDTLLLIKEYDISTYSLKEVVLSYPTFEAIFAYRISHFFYENNEIILARIINEITHSSTSIDIHPGAIIGDNFFIDHGSGLVIGETSIIGNNCKLYQGVILGSKFNNDDKNKRHPTLKDNVIVYANTMILGGKTIIGDNSVIGAGLIIKTSVKENSLIKKSDF